MLHLESQHQGIYSPLNQVMSDSESEEEIHNTSKHRQQQLQQQKKRLGNPPSTLALSQNSKQLRQLLQQQQDQFQRQQNFQLNSAIGNGYQSKHIHQPSSYTTNMQNTFRSVADPSSNFSSFNSDYDERGGGIDVADNVAILGSSSDSKDSTSEPMSAARRYCFIASLLLCVSAVVGFIWLVPCGDSNGGGICPAPSERIKTHNWFNNYTKIELKGGVHIVSGLRSWENNLIFLYRGDVFFPEFRVDNIKHNGIISLVGSSGAVAWYDEMEDEPLAIDCTLLDVDRNGRPDCLVIDEYGELGVINPISGRWRWRFKERNAHKWDSLDFPVMLPDLDGDGVLELLIVTDARLEHQTEPSTNRALEERNFLRILSGRHGHPIGEAFKLHECDAIRKLQLDNKQVKFTCLRNNTEARRSKTLAELYALITNKSIGLKQKFVPPATKITQHRHYGQRKEIDAQRNIYSLSGRELVVENRGKCPEDCNVTLILSETRNGQTYILRNFTNNAMYGMVPAQWSFKNTKTKMSGFVMKFWKWNTQPPEAPETTNSKSFSTKKNKSNATKAGKQNHIQSNKSKKELKHEFPDDKNAFNAFEHVVHKRHTYAIPQPVGANKLHSDANTTEQKSIPLVSSYKMQTITETVILVLFIGADTRIENTSQSNIIQFCHNSDEMNADQICQPDLNNQENSMLIADLDQDGSQELVSYMSTFVRDANDDSPSWKLVTYVRLLRLQSELPAFYGDEQMHN